MKFILSKFQKKYFKITIYSFLLPLALLLYGVYLTEFHNLSPIHGSIDLEQTEEYQIYNFSIDYTGKYSLKIEFDKQGLKYTSKKRLKITYEGKEVGVYEPDFIVEDKIIAEIKSVISMPKVFELQLYYYLRGSKYRLGYITNFGSDKIDIRRRIV